MICVHIKKKHLEEENIDTNADDTVFSRTKKIVLFLNKMYI